MCSTLRHEELSRYKPFLVISCVLWILYISIYIFCTITRGRCRGTHGWWVEGYYRLKKKKKILWRASVSFLSRTRRRSLRRRSDAITSFYILFYEDRCCDPYGSRCRLYENSSFSRSSVCVPSRPGHPIKRDPRRAFRDSPSYPLALKAAHHLIAVVFHCARARSPGKDIKSRVIPVHRFPIQRRAGRNNVIGGIEISRETRSVMFAQQRNASLIIYMHIFPMPVISPIAIIHRSLSMRAQNGLRISLSARLYRLQNIFLVTTSRSLKETPRRVSERERETETETRFIYFLLSSYIRDDHLVGISDATVDSAIASRCTWVPSISSRHDVLWRYYWHFVLPTCRIRSPCHCFFPATSRGSPVTTTRSYMCYSDSAQRVSVPWHNRYLHRAGLLIRRGIPPSGYMYIYIRSSRWLCAGHTRRVGIAMKRSARYFLCARNWLHFTSLLESVVHSLYPICHPALLSRQDINADIYDEKQICRSGDI